MRKLVIFGIILLFSRINASAFLGSAISAAKAAKDEMYQRFMMIKAVEQLKTLRDNYESSMRYHAMFKKLNEGRGFLPNVAHRIGDIGDDVARDAHEQFKDDWIYDKGYGSDVDRLVEKMDKYASDKIRYAGKVFEKSREAEIEAEKISLEADSLDTKAAQRMMIKTQALQLQLSAQTNENLAHLVDVNTRLYKLQLEEKQERIQDWDLFDKSTNKLWEGTKQAVKKKIERKGL